VHKPKTRAIGPWARLKLVGAGLVLAGFGWALQLRGIQAVTHANGQPMFSWGFIGAGLFCVVLALIPTSWVAKAAEIPRPGTGHRH
jgi:amino acid transporter